MIRDHARDRGSAFDSIEAILGPTTLGRAPLLTELARIAQAPGQAIQQVGIQRHDNVGLIEVILRVKSLAKRLACALANVITVDWLPLMPPGLREALEQCLQQIRQRGRGNGLGQDAQAIPLFGLMRRRGRGERCHELAPGTLLALAQNRLRAVWIVERQYLGLAEDVGGAETGWMLRIPLNLDRAARHVADENAVGVAFVRESRREIEREILGNTVGPLHVGGDVCWSLRFGGAAGDTSQGQRCSHELQELLTTD